MRFIYGKIDSIFSWNWVIAQFPFIVILIRFLQTRGGVLGNLVLEKVSTGLTLLLAKETG